jgi:hypothetical protein
MPTLPSPGTQQQTGREAHLNHAAATVPPTSMNVGLPMIPTLPLASDLPISSNAAVRLSPGADGALPLGLFLGTFNITEVGSAFPTIISPTPINSFPFPRTLGFPSLDPSISSPPQFSLSPSISTVGIGGEFYDHIVNHIVKTDAAA